jgi:hypothetical protein
MHAAHLALGLLVSPLSKPHPSTVYPCKVAGPKSTIVYYQNQPFRQFWPIDFSPRKTPIFSSADLAILGTFPDC